MSDDMSNLMNNLSDMLKNNEIPNEVKDFINNFGSNNSGSSDSSSDNIEANTEQNRNESTNSFPDIDISTILKLKTAMDSMKKTKDDPRSNLLISLKPYLRESKREKVDQYVKLFGMSKLIEVIGPMAGNMENLFGSKNGGDK